jgi:hypothetical protein
VTWKGRRQGPHRRPAQLRQWLAIRDHGQGPCRRAEMGCMRRQWRETLRPRGSNTGCVSSHFLLLFWNEVSLLQTSPHFPARANVTADVLPTRRVLRLVGMAKVPASDFGNRFMRPSRTNTLGLVAAVQDRRMRALPTAGGCTGCNFLKARGQPGNSN